MRKKLIAVLGVGAIVAMLASAAFAAVTVTFKAEVKPAKANKPAGLNVRFESKDPAAEQPPIMNRILIKLNEGGKYNSNKFPRCKLLGVARRRPRDRRVVRRSRRSAAAVPASATPSRS